MFRVERRRRLVARRDQLHHRRLNVGIGNTRDQRAKRLRVARIEDYGLLAGWKRAKLEARLGDHGQRAEAPDIKFAEVVAGHILDHLAARASYPAVGMNYGGADQPVARRPVSAAQWAAAGGGDDAADGRTLVAERVERDELSLFGGRPVERRERRPGFNGRGQIGGFVLEHAVHLRGRNNYIKPRGPGAHFEPRPRARRNHAPALAARESHHLAQLFYIAWEGDGAFALVSNAEMAAGRQFRAIFAEHFAQAIDDFLRRDFARSRGLGLMIFHKRFLRFPRPGTHAAPGFMREPQIMSRHRGFGESPRQDWPARAARSASIARTEQCSLLRGRLSRARVTSRGASLRASSTVNPMIISVNAEPAATLGGQP